MNNLGLFFQQIAFQHPKNIALSYPSGRTISYSELNKTSNQIAHYLLAQNIGKADVVAIFNTKHPISFATMIACLKIGAIYCNLDEDNPPPRLSRILKRCNPSIVLSDQLCSENLISCIEELELTTISDFPATFERERNLYSIELPNQCHKVIATDPAYLMFTSGTTGFPKGAIITHLNLISFIQWSLAQFAITPSDCISNVNPIYFDNSVFDFYSALFSGACLLPVPKTLLDTPNKAVEFLTEQNCTLWFSVPSLLVYLNTLKLLNGQFLGSVKHFVFGGEGFPKAELKKIWSKFHQKAKFINVYGPTECTCICSAYEITPVDFEDMSRLAPLGDIIECFDYLILNETLNSVKKGDTGELYLIGPNVGKGYYDNIEDTKASFIQDPRNKRYPELIYKTGDLVKQDKNLLHFCGRTDNQIKHMGYRIELEEIESALNSLDDVIQSAAVYKRVSSRGGRITVFLTSRCKQPDTIYLALNQLLPEYMQPHEIRIVEQLPQNANGKVDRNQLFAML